MLMSIIDPLLAPFVSGVLAGTYRRTASLQAGIKGGERDGKKKGGKDNTWGKGEEMGGWVGVPQLSVAVMTLALCSNSTLAKLV